MQDTKRTIVPTTWIPIEIKQLKNKIGYETRKALHFMHHNCFDQIMLFCAKWGNDVKKNIPI